MVVKSCLCAVVLALAVGTARAETLTDPTRPDRAPAAAAGKPATTDLRVTFIRLGTSPVAVINGQTLRPGDRLGDYTLLAIRSSGVLVSGPNGERVVRLAQTPIKKTMKP